MTTEIIVVFRICHSLSKALSQISTPCKSVNDEYLSLFAEKVGLTEEMPNGLKLDAVVFFVCWFFCFQTFM